MVLASEITSQKRNPYNLRECGDDKCLNKSLTRLNSLVRDLIIWTKSNDGKLLKVLSIMLIKISV